MLANLTESHILLEKSQERLEVAQSLHNDGYFEDSVSRVYYAIFFAARALLLTKNITPKTHRGVNAAGETLREEADYSSERRIDLIRSHYTLEHAQVFVQACSQIIQSI